MAGRRHTFFVIGVAAAGLLPSSLAAAAGWPVVCTPEAGRSYLRYDAVRREVELGGFRAAPRAARAARPPRGTCAFHDRPMTRPGERNRGEVRFVLRVRQAGVDSLLVVHGAPAAARFRDRDVQRLFDDLHAGRTLRFMVERAGTGRYRIVSLAYGAGGPQRGPSVTARPAPPPPQHGASADAAPRGPAGRAAPSGGTPGPVRPLALRDVFGDGRTFGCRGIVAGRSRLERHGSTWLVWRGARVYYLARGDRARRRAEVVRELVGSVAPGGRLCYYLKAGGGGVLWAERANGRFRRGPFRTASGCFQLARRRPVELEGRTVVFRYLKGGQTWPLRVSMRDTAQASAVADIASREAYQVCLRGNSLDLVVLAR